MLLVATADLYVGNNYGNSMTPIEYDYLTAHGYGQVHHINRQNDKRKVYHSNILDLFKSHIHAIR